MQLTSEAAGQLEQSLKSHVRGEVYFDSYQRALYGTDASLYQIQPAGVVIPRTRDDVLVAMQLAAEHNVPIVPRGSGTSLSGQSIGAGLVLDFSKYLNRIIELDPQSQTARVEPGVVLDHLNAAAARHGLQFGPEVATSSRANLGGMIGNNSAGSRSIVNGKTVDHVIALDVLLAGAESIRLEPLDSTALAERQRRGGREGEIHREIEQLVAANREEIIARFPRVIRRVSGYNLDEFVPECRQWLKQPAAIERLREMEAQRYPGAGFNLAKLVIGAEGTLAIVTEALVHLIPLPSQRAIVVIQFDTLAHSVGAVNPILEYGPSAVEMFDGLILRLAERNLEYRHYLDFVVGQPDSMLIAEFSGNDADHVRQQAEELAARMRSQPGATHVVVTHDAAMCNHIWTCRKAALPLLMSVPGGRKPIAFVEDTAVDPQRLPEFVGRFRKILTDNETDGAFYGHASVGCLHIRPMLDSSQADDLARLKRIEDAVAELVLEYGGAMSGEHGDGLARSYLNERLFGPQLYQAFKQVKRAFDPRNLMNPGKVVDGPSPIENLRHGTDYRPLEVSTTFDFSQQGGLAAAAAACNGSGLCRKTRSGTMCPSFMVTGDEEHSTRGRANALRLILSGVLPPAELTGQRLYETFDLCLECKGCKAECPSNVDVAKLKSEFLSQYHAAHGTRLGTRMLAHPARLNRLGSALAPISNWLARAPGSGWLREKLLRIDARRPLPQFVRRNFRAWFAGRAQPAAGARGPIVLLDDCLTSFCEPQVNQSAVALLEAAGYEVHLAGLECCGRAMISKGLLKEAKQLAAENVSRLVPWADRGVPIVGCEPSCLLTLVDEYPDLVPGDEARRVAAAASLVDSHLASIGAQLPLKPLGNRAILHGHCHQKALVGLAGTRNALAQVPDMKLEVLDSGCCGMAGSFGYEHYELSIKIGERVLLPAVRAAADAVVVAPGFSCRQQIFHATGRRALHPAELLARQLEPHPTPA